MYNTSPLDIRELPDVVPGSRIVIKKLLSLNETNLCVPKSNCAANVNPPFVNPLPVLTKSLLR